MTLTSFFIVVGIIGLVAFIGTVIMGAPIAGHLLDAGYDLTVHNRTRSKAEGLLARDFCHEIDHLDGKMYMELVEGDIKDAAAEAAAAEETDE